MIKRIFDILVATAMLIITSPLFLILSILIRIKLGGPVIFAQVRPGMHGTPFKMFKFRTMTNARDCNGTLLSDSDRLTYLGKLLRSSSLDELPELWNVLKGEMSLVGPRPLLMEYLPLYSIQQARRHEVHPGITGWAQINGRNAISWEAKFEFDVWYVDHQSFFLDTKILLLTIKKILIREGINAAGEATMKKFEGSNT